MLSPERVVVGYDGSAESALAVRWAARHAALLDCELQVVHCSLWPLLTKNLGPVKGIAGSGLQHQARDTLDKGTAEALSAAPRVRLRRSLLYGLPADHLRRTADGARMLVLGSRGIGGFMGLLVGSVGLELAATASCPVAVIRFDQNPDGRIVVGIDSSGSAGALSIACALASATGADLMIIHVIRPHGGRSNEAGCGQAAARRLLHTAAHDAHALAPEAVISQNFAQDTSVPRALLNASRGAALIVVGGKGRGLLRGTIGSTAHAVLHHATRPVLIARQLKPGVTAGNEKTKAAAVGLPGLLSLTAEAPGPHC
ncbi:universal stress protein [Pseudarthrobacter psychrotolerans]|uniref:Universal stress protein n=1 Tax=Pseudarthrobacter psychrotolerans TaxID=2697569 RepID=A0A6P1NIR3_9MICC|nr:universal stress protein [Pseudarthrobacter psychrotolerans]QHK19003.1 universal stress protein [Pseudarthrobacter psychrotolerans]